MSRNLVFLLFPGSPWYRVSLTPPLPMEQTLSISHNTLYSARYGHISIRLPYSVVPRYTTVAVDVEGRNIAKKYKYKLLQFRRSNDSPQAVCQSFDPVYRRIQIQKRLPNSNSN